MEPATLIALAVVVGVAARKKGRSSRSSASGQASYDLPRPLLVDGVPFAEGVGRPFWPLVTRRKPVVSYRDVDNKVHGGWGRRFVASRTSDDGTRRNHVGVDLFADVGDVVVATESGWIEATRKFFHGTHAIYFCTDTGLTINYGEVEPRSHREFGWAVGDRVAAGEPIGRVGLMSGGSHMLHIETYRSCRDRNLRWYAGTDAPLEVLNPTDYLLRASQRMPTAPAP